MLMLTNPIVLCIPRSWCEIPTLIVLTPGRATLKQWFYFRDPKVLKNYLQRYKDNYSTMMGKKPEQTFAPQKHIFLFQASSCCVVLLKLLVPPLFKFNFFDVLSVMFFSSNAGVGVMASGSCTGDDVEDLGRWRLPRLVSPNIFSSSAGSVTSLCP